MAKGNRGGGGGGKMEGSIKGVPLETERLLKGLPESQQKDFYFEYGDDKNYRYFEQWQKEHGSLDSQQKAVLAHDAKYAAVQVNIDLPKLEGSPKQVKWAEDIRRQELSKDLNRIVSQTYSLYGSPAVHSTRDPVLKGRLDKLISDANANGIKARNVSDAVNGVFKRRKAYSKYEKQTSAKWIIDNRP